MIELSACPRTGKGRKKKPLGMRSQESSLGGKRRERKLTKALKGNSLVWGHQSAKDETTRLCKRKQSEGGGD